MAHEHRSPERFEPKISSTMGRNLQDTCGTSHVDHKLFDDNRHGIKIFNILQKSNGYIAHQTCRKRVVAVLNDLKLHIRISKYGFNLWSIGKHLRG